MKFSEIMSMAPVNEVEEDRVAEIAESIRANGWVGAPILVSEDCGILITGSHRLAALKMLAEELFDVDGLGDIAENVDEEICAWCEENGTYIDDIHFDNLREVFAGTWVEQYKDTMIEW